MQPRIRQVARAAVIAAVYAGLCLLLAPFSYGVIQVRVAEALTLLPMAWPEAVPGLAVGALIANAVGPFGMVDVVLGTAATTLAAWLTWMSARGGRRRLAPLWPVIINGLVVGAYVPFVAGLQVYFWTIPASMLSVAAGEAIAVYALGVPMMRALKRLGVIE